MCPPYSEYFMPTSWDIIPELPVYKYANFKLFNLDNNYILVSYWHFLKYIIVRGHNERAGLEPLTG